MKRLHSHTRMMLACISIFLLTVKLLFSQEFTAGINTETPNPNAVLHLVAPNGDQGLIIPKLTSAQRTGMALGVADEGIMVYDEEDQNFYFWNGAAWVVISTGAETDPIWTADRTTLGSTGTINNPANLIDWTQLKNVPGDFADGIDDGLTAVTSADITDGEILDADINAGAAIAWGKINKTGGNVSELTNDAGYLTAFTEIDPVWTGDRTTLASVGTINNAGNLIDWTQLKNVPGTFADGTDDGLTVVTSADITNNEIVDADINTGAAIAWAKISKTGGNVSELTNDAGYLTTFAEIDPIWTGDRTTLASVGTINNAGNLIDWTQLKNVPGTFADGTDDGLTVVTSADITDGQIVNADINAGAAIAWGKIDKTGGNVSELTNDAGYLTAFTELDPVWTGDRTTLASVGTINNAGNLIDWTQLKNVPGTFADGTDDGLTVVTSADITNNEIVDADINTGAAIAWAKISKTGANVSELTNDVGYLTAFTELDPVWTGDRTTLASVGTINNAGNLIDWTQLKNVPGTFADGTDDGLTVVTSADITNNEIVDADINTGAAIAWAKISKTGANVSELTNDAGYLTAFTELDPVWTGDRTTLASVGTINNAGNLIDWTQLKNVPGTFADGVDDGLTVVTSADITDNEIVNADINTGAAIAWGKIDKTGGNVSELANDAAYLTSFTELDPVWTGDRTTLASVGTINNAGNLIDWTQLKSVPADFADGTDDGGLWIDNAGDINYSAGLVGIGITTPRRELHLDGPAGGISFQMTNSASGNADLNTGFVIDYNDGPTQEVDFIHNEGFNIRFGESGSTHLTVDNQNDKVITSPLETNAAGTVDAFDLTQTGTGRTAVITTNNTGSINSALEVSSNGAAGSFVARFDRNTGSTGGGLFIDMNNVNSLLEPAIQIENTTVPFRIFDGSFDGGILISDGSGNMTFTDGISINREGRFNIASTTLSGTGGNLASPSTGQFNILLGRTAGSSLGNANSNIMIGDIVAPTASTGSNNIMFGNTVSTAMTTGSDNISMGRNSGGTVLNTGSNNIFIGNGAELSGGDGSLSNNIVIGPSASASGPNAIAIGNTASSSANNTVSLGHNTNASVNGSVSIGEGATSSAVGAVAIGQGAQANFANTVTLGNAGGTNYDLQVTGNANTDGNLTVNGVSEFLDNITFSSNTTIIGNIVGVLHTDPTPAQSLPAHIIQMNSNGTVNEWYDNGTASGTICKVINFSGGPITYTDANNISPVGGTFVQAANQIITMIFIAGADVWLIED